MDKAMKPVIIFNAIFIIFIASSSIAIADLCVRLTDCPYLLEKLTKKPVTAEKIQEIRNAHCGWDTTDNTIEKVMCPQNTRSKKVDTSKEVELININFTTTTEPIKIETKNLIQTDQCAEAGSYKVIGGSATELDEYPWTALLRYRRSKKLYYGCGGSLINNRYVLTAAHCVTHSRFPPISVVLGEYDTVNQTDCLEFPGGGGEDCAPPPIDAPIESISVHSNWLQKGRRPFYDDIALLRLQNPVEFSQFVKPICLPAPSRAWKQEQVVAVGWGATEEAKKSRVKLQVSLPTVPAANCSKSVNMNISSTQICAGGVPGKDICTGDSGGPLMSFNITSFYWELVGISSLSKGGCGMAVPSIYTYVPAYVEWIYSVIKP